MNRAFFLLGVSFFLVFCNQGNTKVKGLYKISRVEVFKNNELKRIIDTGCQYWNFTNSSSIQICNRQKLKIVLNIKTRQKTIQSIDAYTGSIIDEFTIQKFDDLLLELCSRKQLNNVEYSIIYFLEKVTDTAKFAKNAW